MHARATRTAISTDTESSFGARCLYWFAIAGTLVLSLVLLARLIAILEVSTVAPLVLGLLAGIAAADLVTGAVHWACDTWGSEKTPWLGQYLIRSFREHHTRPTAMLEHDWVDVNGGAAVGAFAGLATFLWLFPESSAYPRAAFAFGAAFFVALAVVSAMANQLHYWAHAKTAPAAIRRLQRAGFVLSRREHAGHHRAPHAHGYCISTGWLNRPLDAIGFWRGLEKMVTVIFGAQPREGDRD